jgi:hypothetical protein
LAALLSLRAYSRHRGCTLKAVQKAIETGRITLIGEKLDAEIADYQWAKNTRPDQQERGSLAQFERTQADLASQVPGESSPAAAAENRGQGNNLSIEKSETELVRRQLLELQLAQKRGELVRTDDVEKAMANKLKTASEILNSLADRLAPQLAAETDVNKLDAMLRSEIRRAMAAIVGQAPASIN